jgi:hypothetical protein
MELSSLLFRKISSYSEREIEEHDDITYFNFTSHHTDKWTLYHRVPAFFLPCRSGVIGDE